MWLILADSDSLGIAFGRRNVVSDPSFNSRSSLGPGRGKSGWGMGREMVGIVEERVILMLGTVDFRSARRVALYAGVGV